MFSQKAPAFNPLKSAVDKEIDHVVRQYMQKSNAVGLSIGIIKDGRTSAFSYGKTERGNGKLPNAESIFEIGSITKTFTAAILAWFVNEGKIRLDDRITKYLPHHAAANSELQRIKIVHLANHTSGLSRLPSNFFLRIMSLRNPYKGYTNRMLFLALKRCSLISEPGKVYGYSNLAVGLLGNILETISGKTYEQLVKQIITGPLKMESTLQHITPELSQCFTKAYNRWGIPAIHWDFDALAACGSLRSTVNDLLIYAQANMQDDDSELSKAFTLTHKITFAKGPKVALGWHLLTLYGVDYYWHNGGTYGSHSFLLFNAERGIAVIVLSNSAVNCDLLAINILKKLQQTNEQ